MVATAYDSLGVLADKFSKALDAGKGVNAAASGLQMTALLLPVAGMTATSGRIGRRVVGGAWRWSDGDPVRRTAIGALLAGGVALAAFTWWPNGEYRPIQPGEKGTLASGVDAIGAVPTGRPALTRERERQLHGAPTVREHGGDFRHIAPAAPQDSTGEDSGGQTQTTPDATTTTPTTTTPAAATPDPATTTPAPTETTPADPAVAPEAQTTTPSPTTGTP
jgi:hypothetical protein